MKFKVGDLIRGTNSRYFFTNSDMLKGVIVDIIKDDVQIKVLEHKSPRCNGYCYWALSPEDIDFEVIEKKSKIDEANGNKEAYFDLLPTTLKGVAGYIVDDWKNVLKAKELPDRYRVEDGAYFAEYDNGTGVVLFDILNTVRFIHRGDFISKELWKNYYSVMVKAGHRLTTILREERKPKMIRFKI